MQLTFLILVICYCISNSSPTCALPPDSTWRPSRYIIDNRRNALFSKKPFTIHPHEDHFRNPASFNPNPYKRLYSNERYHKDLAAEASIAGPKFYRKYDENSLPRKIIKSLKINEDSVHPREFYNVFESQKNDSEVFDPQNFIQNEVLNEVTSKPSSTTEKTVKDTRSSNFDSSTPTWEIGNSKTEEGNQIDNTNEKHVYETRIETVSYHQEVIFNPPKKEKWFDEQLKQNRKYEKQETVKYEIPETNYEETVKNYEESEQNYEEPEQNYEKPEQNYEEPEQNYEKPEQNYEEPERNYEQPERNYEQPEKSYEEPEKSYEEPEKSYEEPEKSYELDENMPGREIHSPESGQNQNKFGYVVEGTNYRKYRVEERTMDGFIVGEYGVVSHNDGSLRGVRYTADGNTNPQLIYETLIKFLSL